MSASQYREHLIRALEADLIGPFDSKALTNEVLPLPPSRWYMTGFLAPSSGREVDESTNDEYAAGPDEPEEETAGHEPELKQKSRLPSSLGMSVLIPPGSTTDTVLVTVSFSEYRAKNRSSQHIPADDLDEINIWLKGCLDFDNNWRFRRADVKEVLLQAASKHRDASRHPVDRII